MGYTWFLCQCQIGLYAIDAVPLLTKSLTVLRAATARREHEVTGGYHTMGSDWQHIDPVLWVVMCCLFGLAYFYLLVRMARTCEEFLLLSEAHALSQGLRLRPIFRSRWPAWQRQSPAKRKALLAPVALTIIAVIVATIGLPWGGTIVPLGPSYPLSVLNETFYYGLTQERIANPHRAAEPEYGVEGQPVPTFLRNSALYLAADQLDELDALLETSTEKIRQRYSSSPRHRPGSRHGEITRDVEQVDDKPFRLGQNLFKTTATEGLGFATTTFFSELNTTRLGLPSYLAPRDLEGLMYSNNVTTNCYDVTTRYLFRDLKLPSDPFALHRIGSLVDFSRWLDQPRVTPANATAEPVRDDDDDDMGTSFYVSYTDGGTKNVFTAMQVLFFRPADPRVLECGYSVAEFKRPASLHRRGAVVEGAPRALEAVLGEVAQGYYSLLRQRVERADLRLTADQVADERAVWKNVGIMLRTDLNEWMRDICVFVLQMMRYVLQFLMVRAYVPTLLRWFSFARPLGYETGEAPEQEECIGPYCLYHNRGYAHSRGIVLLTTAPALAHLKHTLAAAPPPAPLPESLFAAVDMPGKGVDVGGDVAGGRHHHFGVFPAISRLNHDCGPNAAAWTDKTGLVHRAFASKDIAAGEEISISYVDALAPRAERRARMAGAWGFECGCRRCAAGDESDARVAEIKALEARLGDVAAKVTMGDIERYLELMKEEGLEGKMAGAYTTAALNYSLFGKQGLAVRHARLALECGLREEGPHAADVAAMRELAKAPKEHFTWRGRVR
ncbi:Plasma membrane iron permease [Verticillium dahliae VDG2]|nr:Plasma membrane iron permease [Verticillium dahliae VDG2]